MTDTNSSKIEPNNEANVSEECAAETDTLVHRIKDVPVEKFTKVSEFGDYFLFYLLIDINFVSKGWNGAHCRRNKVHKCISIECVAESVFSLSNI